MKLKPASISFIAIITLLLLSCGEKLKHEDEVQYYVTMQKTRNQQIKSWNIAMKACNNAYNLSTWNEEGKITEGYADTVKATINRHIAKVDSAIILITSMKELDKKINLKQIMLDYLNHSKDAWKNGMTVQIDMMRTNGLNRLTDSQEIKYEAIQKDMDDLAGEEDGMDYYIQEFAIKHKVSSSELLQFDME